MPRLRHALFALAALLPLAACGGGGGTTVAADGTVAPSPKGDIVLSNMGSYHVGGRAVTIVGKPVRDVQFTPAARSRASTPTARSWSNTCTRNGSNRAGSAVPPRWC